MRVPFFYSEYFNYISLSVPRNVGYYGKSSFNNGTAYYIVPSRTARACTYYSGASRGLILFGCEFPRKRSELFNTVCLRFLETANINILYIVRYNLYPTGWRHKLRVHEYARLNDKNARDTVNRYIHWNRLANARIVYNIIHIPNVIIIIMYTARPKKTILLTTIITRDTWLVGAYNIILSC